MHQLTTPQGGITIRPAMVEDAEALRELRLEALANHPQAFAADYALTAAESSEIWANRLRDNALENKATISIAEFDRQLIGMAGISPGHWPKTRYCGVIWGVYVKAAWRGYHLAEALIEECIDWGRAHEMVITKLGVVTTNLPAIRCYSRCGFTIYGIDPKVIYYDGVFYDELLMARPI